MSDLVETNSGTFVDETDTGTNPALCDTDEDGARDSWEIANGGDPFLATDFLASVSPRVTITPFTVAESAGIDSAKEYTHAVSGGGAAVINGVTFEVLTPAIQPANLLWTAGDFNQNALAPIQNRDWDPALAGITDSDIIEMLGGFTFSGNGANPGASQNFTLTGLTVGRTYELKLYIRPWSQGGSGRNIDLTFTNGDEIVQPFGSFPEDRPGVLTGSGEFQEAYVIGFVYTAQETELSIDASIHPCLQNTNGSFHMYGLSNEISGPPVTPQITITRLFPNGALALGFVGNPSTTYRVSKSYDLGIFTPVEDLEATTDFEGNGQVVISPFENDAEKLFYRIEEIE